MLVVIGYHLGWGWIGGGFLGVDLFFVLSGYLITGLLLGEVARSGGVDLGRFYARRLRRLFPAMAVLLLVFAAVALRSDPLDRTTMRADGLSALLDVANWHFIASGASYFAQFSAPSALRHTWSLAIEEQFYLVWPPLVLALATVVRRRRHQLAVVGALAAGSFALSLLLYRPGDDPSRVYFGTDTRAFTLLVGALLAIVDRHARFGPTSGRRIRAWTVFGLPAAALMVAMFLLAGDRDAWIYRGGLLAFAGAAAVVIGAAHGGPIGAALSVRPLRWVGTVSYGLYLWHWPLDVWLTPRATHVDGWPLDLVRIAATFAIATASYYLLERVVRQGRFPRRAPLEVLGWSFALLVAAVTVSTLGAQPVPDYLRATNRTGRNPVVIRAAGSTTPTTAPQATAPRATTPGVPTTTPPPTRPARRVLLFGDSVAASVQTALGDDLTAHGVTFADGTVVGCGVVLGDPADPHTHQVTPAVRACSGVIGRIQDDAVRQVQPDLILLFSTWEREDRIVDGQYFAAGTLAWSSRMIRLFDETIGRLTASGAKVALVLPPDPVEGRTGKSEVADRASRTSELRGLLERVALRHRDVATVIDLASAVCPRTPCPTVVDGIELRGGDGIHFDNLPAQRWAARRLVELVTKLDLDHLGNGAAGGAGPATHHPPPS
ncbi:MAG: acyltransferase 3 [Acidimicrobiales bacterium]|nr:acyltransferase 3 [Acidimicrobiales bacterium]